MKTTNADKVYWHGKIVSVQPRIRLLRSFDERSHNYMGYMLRVDGTIGGEKRRFTIGIGKGAQEKHVFRVGDTVGAESCPVQDPRTETVEFYKTSKIKISGRAVRQSVEPPPWTGETPDLPTYRQRGHRRLDADTYESQCLSCIWGCRMPVEVTVDKWKPHIKEYRVETVCYGPKSCPLYVAGPAIRVPGKDGTVWEEDDRVDEETTAHRSPDE